MKKAVIFLSIICVCFMLVSCGYFSGWKTYTGPGYTISLPGVPTIRTENMSIPGMGLIQINIATLSVTDPLCTISITSFESIPSPLDIIPGLTDGIVYQYFGGNLIGNKSTPMGQVGDFTVTEFQGVSAGKAIMRVYRYKTSMRIVKIFNQTSALNVDFVNKVFNSFKPGPIQAK